MLRSRLKPDAFAKMLMEIDVFLAPPPPSSSFTAASTTSHSNDDTNNTTAIAAAGEGGGGGGGGGVDADADASSASTPSDASAAAAAATSKATAKAISITEVSDAEEQNYMLIHGLVPRGWIDPIIPSSSTTTTTSSSNVVAGTSTTSLTSPHAHTVSSFTSPGPAGDHAIGQQQPTSVDTPKDISTTAASLTGDTPLSTATSSLNHLYPNKLSLVLDIFNRHLHSLFSIPQTPSTSANSNNTNLSSPTSPSPTTTSSSSTTTNNNSSTTAHLYKLLLSNPSSLVCFDLIPQLPSLLPPLVAERFDTEFLAVDKFKGQYAVGGGGGGKNAGVMIHQQVPARIRKIVNEHVDVISKFR